MATTGKNFTIPFADGTTTDVLVRINDQILELEIQHWFLGPLSVKIERAKARLLAATLIELLETQTGSPETFQVGQ